ncbi:MAG: PEP-CTERM sorting domain-containing protein [Phycisphaerae bacterium]|nr:PEP-CTERM sorting domain-containing protein [Phycisphaerae bacterium]
MSCGKTLMAVAVAAIGFSAHAATLTGNLTGGYNNPGWAGQGNPGLINGAAKAGDASGGRLGIEFAGPTLVESFTIAQVDEGGRRRIALLDVYADGQYIGQIELTDTCAAQTVYFADFGIENLQATWLTLVVPNVTGSLHGNGDPNGGPAGFSFGGTAYVSADPSNDVYRNLNAGIKASNITVVNTLTGAYNGAAARETLTDGKLLAADTSNVFWQRGEFVHFDAGQAEKEHALTIAYDAAQTVASVGIAFAGDKGRDIPRWVVISGYNSTTDTLYSERIDFDVEDNPTLALLIQYGRYDLPTVFEDVDWLKLTFPPSDGTSADAANWWLNGDQNFGVVEFQAFGVIPEPATMTLLALGGLALLRRRK